MFSQCQCGLIIFLKTIVDLNQAIVGLGYSRVVAHVIEIYKVFFRRQEKRIDT